MKYPSMNRGSKYRVEVPQLSGGTNMADAVQRVEDNQLTDSLNVWWHDNVLQTRPGLQKTGEAAQPVEETFTSNGAHQNPADETSLWSGNDTFRLSRPIDTTKGGTVKIQFKNHTYTIRLTNTYDDLMWGRTAEEIEREYVGDPPGEAKYCHRYLEVYIYNSGKMEFSCIRKSDDGGESTNQTGIPARAGANNITVTATAAQTGEQIFGTTWTKTVVQVLNEQETFLIHWNNLGSGNWNFRAELLSTRDNPSYANRGTGTVTVASSAPNALLVRAPKGADTDWYAILPDKVLQHTLTEGDPGAEEWTTVTDYYIPTVLVNGKGNRVSNGSLTGTLYEGYNLLTSQFKAKFTSDGETNNSTKSYLGSNRFQMPCKIDTSQPASIEIVFTEHTYTINLPADAGSNRLAGSVQIDGKYIGGTLDAYPITFLDALLYEDGTLEFSSTRKNSQGGYSTVTDGIPARAATNNITVTAAAAGITAADHRKIGSMTRCCWFGGDRSGLAGGTRLFVCGNPEEPNLICWSDVNKPLYFPENNYAYVGDTSQPVTGFGKQGDLLMIFKESELYAAQYVAGTSYSAEDVESGKIVDVAAAAAQFPLTPIHPTIGCDCPDTIRLVNNRLCWADSSGYVYMLPAVNQYNERVVREISDNIRRALVTHTKEEWRSARACEYSGHYLLAVGRRAYLLETNNSSYASYTYYAKETAAQRLLPWYIWEFPAATFAIAGDRERVRLIQGGYAYTFAGDTDDGSAIHSRFETKLFDFGKRQAGKGIHQLYITVADAGCTARVSYITEDYTAEDAYLIEAEETETPYSAGYFRPFRLSPNLHRVREFGIRCESDGKMAVAGLSIDYTIQGVVR